MMTLADFKRRATDERAGLRRIYDQAQGHLEPLELVRLADHLATIKPCSIIDGAGRRRKAEPPFKLRPKDRRALALALLESGVSESRIPSLIGMPPRTWGRLRAKLGAGTPKTGDLDRLNKRENRPFQSGLVPWPTCTCSERGSRPVAVATDPGLCHTCGCRFGEAENPARVRDSEQPFELREAA